MYTDNDILLGRARLGDELLGRSHDKCTPRSATPSCESCEDKCTPDVKKSWGLVGYPLAMVYSPVQSFASLYELDDGFARGTIFSELDLPFLAYNEKGGSCCGQ